jgi:Periplasmic protein involved in polysaccharide export
LRKKFYITTFREATQEPKPQHPFVHSLLFSLIIIILVSTPILAQDLSDRIHFGDLVDIDVIGSVDYDWRGTLTPEGFLDGFDLIPKQVFALCRTEADLATEIAGEYSRILREPKVIVRVLDRSNRAVAMMNGAVRTPHRYRIQRPARLNELVVYAGGILDTASGEIRIQRPRDLSCRGETADVGEQTGPTVLIVKISDLIKGEADANPYILSGDIVTVLEAYPIYVIGGVTRPGKIDSREQITLSRAVSIAGGLTKNGQKNKVNIYRRGGETAIIEADLEKIEAGTAEDPILKPFDVVDVTQTGGRPRRLAPDPESIRRGTASGDVKPPLKIIE